VGSGRGDTEAEDGVRLAMLEAVPADADVSDVLGTALLHAVAGVRGLCGLAHLSGREEGTLRLVAASGAPPGLTGAWELLTDATSGLAPTRAFKDGGVVWSQARPPATPGRQTIDHPRGVLSAPIIAGDIPVGAVSVMATDEPPEDRKRYLCDLAAAVGGRLAKAGRWRSGTAPWWQIPTDPTTMRKVKAAKWSRDLNSGTLDVDAASEPLLVRAGLDPNTWDRHIRTWIDRIHPADREEVMKEIARAQRERSTYVVEYRVLDAQNRESWLLLCGWLVYDTDGHAVKMDGFAWDITERRSQEQWLAGMLDSYPQPTYVLSADDRVVWANAAARGLADREQYEILGRTPWESMPSLQEQGLPDLLAAARAAPGRPATLTVTSWTQRRGVSAYYELTAVGISDFVSVTLNDVTDKTQTALAAAERRERLTGLNQDLIKARTPQHVVDAVIGHVMPLVGADRVLIHDLTGAAPELAGSVGYSPEFLAELAPMGWPQNREGSAVDARPQFVASADELAERWPHLVPLARLEGEHSWVILPLLTAEEQVGNLVLSWSGAHTFSPDEEALLGTVAVAIAAAFSRAAEFREALRLQAELMPGRLPALTAVSAAAQYRTASVAGLGGDWYDAYRLPGGRSLFVVGGVTGHGRGLGKLSAMGVLRQAIAAIAALDLPPDEILAHANDVALRLGARAQEPVMVTCLLALYDPTTGHLALASSGHPPPLMMPPGRQPTALSMPVGEPLGLPHVPPEATELSLDDGTVVALFTDGLLGPAAHANGAFSDPVRLAALIARHGASPLPADPARRGRWLEALCEAAFGTLLTEPNPDDAALLVLAAGRVPAGRIATWDMPRAPESAAAARAAVDGQLSRWGLDELSWSADQVISELVGNCARHAVGIGVNATDDAPGAIRIRLLYLDNDLVIEVYDGSEAAPHVRHPSYDQEFGRGLPIVAFVSRRWGARHTGARDPEAAGTGRRTTASKCVWASLALPDET
jgi:PAS domain-containing protein